MLFNMGPESADVFSWLPEREISSKLQEVLARNLMRFFD